MKKLLLFAFAVFAFAACTQNEVEELSANRADVPETLTVGFEGGDDTRIQLNEAQKTVWTKEDLVSVFYRSDANQKWQYQGETGERVGVLKRVENATSTTKTTKTIVVYPYSENYWLNTDSYYIDAMLPAVQHYAEDSYGVGENLMVSQSEFTQFTLKNVCGWLKLQLTGNGEKVHSITLRGNNEEQLAGLIYVDTDTAESTLVSEMGGYDDMENSVGGGLQFDDTIFTELTLDCGEGVELGAAAKSFYIAVPPQTFVGGFTVDVECDNGTSITKSTSESITIERNHIKPMEAIEYDGVLPEVYELAYRTNDGKALDPFTAEGFGGEFEENIFDAATGEGKLVFAGAITTIPDNAFGLCENLTWIEIPLGVTSIGASAFSDCSSMEEITIPASVTSVGSEAFKGCTGKAYINCSGVSFSGAGFAEVVIGDSAMTIGDCAFYDCDSLTSVTIGDSVTTIGGYAFAYCDSLTSITIPDSVTTIGYDAFRYCNSLTSVTIGNSVTTIGTRAFYNCDSLTEFNGKFASEDGRCLIVDGTLNSFAPAGLTSYTIPDSVTTIGNSAFSRCSSLTGVTIPDSVTTIGDSAFWGCDSLTSVTIPDSVTTIGEEAFASCYSLTSVTIGDSVTTIGDSAFYSCESLTSVYCEATTPPSLGGSDVFDKNASDRTIYVPEKSVRQYKFAEGWSEYADYIVGYDFKNGVDVEPEVSINSVIRYTATAKVEAHSDYPWSFDTFGANILSHDFNEESGEGVITFDADVTTIVYRAFQNCDSLTSITIPDSVTTIGDYAFYGCDSLTSITIPDSVTTIGDDAFYYCRSLTSVTISDSVTTIGKWAFQNCDSLTSITFGDSVTTIGYGAFYGCSSLTSVTIPDSVTAIGDSAFSDCYSLTSITIPNSVTTIGDSAFRDCDSLTSVTIPDSVMTIGDGAFWGCGSLTSVTIPDSVTTIGDYAFAYCTNLISITIGDSVTTIGEAAFYDCDSLTSVTIPDSVTTIGGGAFFGCGTLTSVTIGDSVTTIEYEAFSSCDSLTSITIPDSVTTIGEGVFSFCRSLTSVTIGNSVTTIGDYAFSWCISLTSITISDSVTTIGGGAFSGCGSLTEFNGKFASEDGRCLIVDGTLNSFAPAGLTSYTIPDSVTTIGAKAFYNCSSLTSVTIPDSVTTIGDYTFAYCDILTSVYCEATTPPSLGGSYVFGNNASGRKIYVPAASVEAYKSAWSDYANAIESYNF